MGTAYDITRRHSITENALSLWLLQFIQPISQMFPEPSIEQFFCSYIYWDWAPQLCISLEVI